jgi:IS1 family transposase/transposase-like protein
MPAERQEPNVTCHNCRTQMVKAGFYGTKKVQRWKCQQCNKRFSEPQPKPFGVDVRLPVEKVTMILHCLAEGNSVRSTARLCDVEKRTVLNLLRIAGDCCERFMERTLRDIPVRDLELDECWSYVLKKQGHTLPHESTDESIGDQYIYIALERSSKLVVAWHLGKRDRNNTSAFIAKIRSATAKSWFDVSTDAWAPYTPEIDRQLSDRANHSIVVKVYDKPEETRERYSPGNFVTVEKSVGSGYPDLERACTSHVERKNGTLRQWCRRLTRLTYAFNKKKENLYAALALHFWHYNFARIHSASRVTPAMQAGVANRVWTIQELLETAA